MSLPSLLVSYWSLGRAGHNFALTRSLAIAGAKRHRCEVEARADGREAKSRDPRGIEISINPTV